MFSSQFVKKFRIFIVFFLAIVGMSFSWSFAIAQDEEEAVLDELNRELAEKLEASKEESEEQAEPKEEKVKEESEDTITGKTEQEEASQEKTDQEPVVAETMEEKNANDMDEKPEISPAEASKWYDHEKPTGDACLDRCNRACDCRWKLGGGGPVIMALHHFGYHSGYGDLDGFGIWVGGRGYGYLLDDQLRIGGMGVGGGVGSNVSETTVAGKNLLNDSEYRTSSERSVGGGYGGVTLEYVFRLMDGAFEIPIGALVGFGGAGYSSRVGKVESINGDVVVQEDGLFFALQPMAGIDINASRWMRIGVAGTMLYTPVVQGKLDDLSGAGVMVNIMFGNFTHEALVWE